MGAEQSKNPASGKSLSEVVQQIAADYITTPSFAKIIGSCLL